MSDDIFEAEARRETECQDAELVDRPSFYAGYMAGAHYFSELERARSAKLAEALDDLSKCSYTISRSAAWQRAVDALSEYKKDTDMVSKP